MKILKIVLIVVIVLIAIPLVLALFIKKEYLIEREVTINRPAADVFNYIKLMRNQEQYSKWVMADPNMKKEMRGTDGTVGAIYAWNGNKEAGEGEQELIKVDEGNRVDMELRFKRPMENTAYVYMTTAPSGENSTLVKWGMHGKSKYPFNFMNMMMDGMLGKDMEISLISLKNQLESKQ